MSCAVEYSNRKSVIKPFLIRCQCILHATQFGVNREKHEYIRRIHPIGELEMAVCLRVCVWERVLLLSGLYAYIRMYGKPCIMSIFRLVIHSLTVHITILYVLGAFFSVRCSYCCCCCCCWFPPLAFINMVRLSYIPATLYLGICSYILSAIVDMDDSFGSQSYFVTRTQRTWVVVTEQFPTHLFYPKCIIQLVSLRVCTKLLCDRWQYFVNFFVFLCFSFVQCNFIDWDEKIPIIRTKRYNSELNNLSTWKPSTRTFFWRREKEGAR